MADHEDYETGAAPAAHGPSHGAGQSDEISVAALSGELLDAQHPKPHYIAGVAHIADNLASLNTKIEDATLEDKTVLENTMDAKVATHAALPTIHQDAPALIATHKADASAHHAKYTDAEARAAFSPISIPPSSFIPQYDTYDFNLTEYLLANRTSTTLQYFYSSVQLPHGCTITKLTMYGYRDDADAVLLLHLFRTDHENARVVMASVTANWTTGYSSIYDDTIASPVIDNNGYQYSFRLTLDPNLLVGDVKFTGAKIEFTG